jgi:hypothetical protein
MAVHIQDKTGWFLRKPIRADQARQIARQALRSVPTMRLACFSPPPQYSLAQGVCRLGW